MSEESYIPEMVSFPLLNSVSSYGTQSKHYDFTSLSLKLPSDLHAPPWPSHHHLQFTSLQPFSYTAGRQALLRLAPSWFYMLLYVFFVISTPMLDPDFVFANWWIGERRTNGWMALLVQEVIIIIVIMYSNNTFNNAL